MRKLKKLFFACAFAMLSALSLTAQSGVTPEGVKYTQRRMVCEKGHDATLCLTKAKSTDDGLNE